MTKRELEQENEGLREELKEIVQAASLCRYCKHADADCSPTDHSCNPEWRGLKK